MKVVYTDKEGATTTYELEPQGDYDLNAPNDALYFAYETPDGDTIEVFVLKAELFVRRGGETLPWR
jgi:hypothetical protein